MDKEIELKLTLTHVNQLLTLLGKQTLNEVIDVFTEIRKQTLAQLPQPKE